MAFTWTEEAENFLKEYYATHDTRELADELGISMTAVRAKAFRLNLKKDYNDVPEGHYMCSRCKQVYLPPNGKRGNGYCRPCNAERQREKALEKKIQQSKEAKGITEIEKIIAETAEQTYVCNTCGKEKQGKEFKFDKRRKKRESMCYECRNERNKESKLKMIKKGRGW